mmetsp:Transcript_4019/g.5282  ORF Transcript_4019/g.5282 Transcript_4019/m.5282 type:complete len:398 (-) Transcript_4019:225-1418(-)
MVRQTTTILASLHAITRGALRPTTATPKRKVVVVSSRSLSTTLAVHVESSRYSHTAATSTTAKHEMQPPPSTTTLLVDELLAHTRELMGPHSTIKQHVIAYSGGVDSSLVASLLFQSRQSDNEQVRAVLGLSPAVPQEQIDLAKKVADHIGIPLSLIRTTEGEDAMYIENSGQACLACKTNLYSSLQQLQATIIDHVANESLVMSGSSSSEDNSDSHHLQLYNGTNEDDRKDSTRVGLIAAQNFHVRSPVQHLTKNQVRQVAKHLGLPNWNYAASPCLRSRLALGVPATADRLHRVEEAERYVRKKMCDTLDETSNLRVRLLAKNRARIELDADHMEAAMEINWNEKFVEKLGFSSVSIQSFRSGSVAIKTKADKDSNNAEVVSEANDVYHPSQSFG